jgi:hypothetical protein
LDDNLEYFLVVSKHRMISHYFVKFKTCIESLNDEDIWKADKNDGNSIGGIIYHVIEHIMRNVMRLSDSTKRFNKGMEDYFPVFGKDKDLLMEELERAFNRLRYELEQVDHKQVNPYDIYHLVEHTGYHLGQVVDRAQRISGIRYQFVQNGINEKVLKDKINEEIR